MSVNSDYEVDGLVDRPHLQYFKEKLDDSFVAKTDYATLSSYGIVQPDGLTITFDGNNKLKAIGGGGGSSTLADLTDVDLGTLTDNQLLTYDADSDKWVNEDLPTASTSEKGVVKVDGISVTIDSSGTIHATGGSGSSTLSGLADVDLDDPTDSQVLRYDSTSGKWINDDGSEYELPIASTTELGGVMVDGTSVTIDADGTIHASGGGGQPVEITSLWSDVSGITYGTMTLSKAYTNYDVFVFKYKYNVPGDGWSERAYLSRDVAVGDILTIDQYDARYITITVDSTTSFNIPASYSLTMFEITGIKFGSGGGGGGASSLAELTDVDLDTPEDNQTLKYDTTSDKWINKAVDVVCTMAEYNAMAYHDPSLSYYIDDYKGVSMVSGNVKYYVIDSDHTLTTDSSGYLVIPVNHKLYRKMIVNSLISNTNGDYLVQSVDTSETVYVKSLDGNSSASQTFTDGILFYLDHNIDSAFTDLIAVLEAGETMISINDDRISTYSTVDVYTDVYGVNPTGITVTNGNVTITFDARGNDINVKVRIS